MIVARENGFPCISGLTETADFANNLRYEIGKIEDSLEQFKLKLVPKKTEDNSDLKPINIDQYAHLFVSEKSISDCKESLRFLSAEVDRLIAELRTRPSQ